MLLSLLNNLLKSNPNAIMWRGVVFGRQLEWGLCYYRRGPRELATASAMWKCRKKVPYEENVTRPRTCQLLERQGSLWSRTGSEIVLLEWTVSRAFLGPVIMDCSDS